MKTYIYPDKYVVQTISKIDAEITAPSSKAHTLRAIYIAALAQGKSVIKKPLLAEDQMYAIEALRKMGVRIDIDQAQEEVTIYGNAGKFAVADQQIYIGNSGMTARFLAVLGSLANMDITIDGTERMRTARPFQDLIEALAPLGVIEKSRNNNGCVPIDIKADSFTGGTTTLKGDKSSQYFSAILLCAPYAKNDVRIITEGKLVSKPYVDITISIMKDFGVEVVNNDYKEFLVKAGQKYIAREYQIEGDYSSASFFFEAAAITSGKIKINNLFKNSAQGDKKFVDYLEMMGCKVHRGADYVELEGKPLKGITVDMCDEPDIAVPLMVVAAFAKGETQITNISHLIYKESDRIKAPVNELNKMNIRAVAGTDSVTIQGASMGEIKSVEIETYNDHRMAMSFTVAGLKVPGIIINNPKCVDKSFPDFFEIFESLY
jgi:3-phosphoshikimate 1-carboxyvinyltransferase